MSYCIWPGSVRLLLPCSGQLSRPCCKTQNFHPFWSENEITTDRAPSPF